MKDPSGSEFEGAVGTLCRCSDATRVGASNIIDLNKEYTQHTYIGDDFDEKRFDHSTLLHDIDTPRIIEIYVPTYTY